MGSSSSCPAPAACGVYKNPRHIKTKTHCVRDKQTLGEPASRPFPCSLPVGAGKLSILPTEVISHQKRSVLFRSLCVCCTHTTPTTLPATAACPERLRLFDRRWWAAAARTARVQSAFRLSFVPTTVCRSHTRIGRDFPPGTWEAVRCYTHFPQRCGSRSLWTECGNPCVRHTHRRPGCGTFRSKQSFPSRRLRLPSLLGHPPENATRYPPGASGTQTGAVELRRPS